MSDIISREDAREAIEDLMDIHFDRQVVLAKARDAIVSLPSAVCDDCIWHVCNYNKVDWDGEDGYISKRDALAEFRDGRDVYDIMESIEELPSAEPNLMEDGTLEVNVHDARLVKRVLIGDEKHWGGLYYPDAEPKTGAWISNHDGTWNCSECGLRVFVYAKGNFCPNCGADMRGENHE